MAQLAIKGHATRGKEVIEILEMLGGRNKYNVTFTETNLIYCLREDDNVIIATYPNIHIKHIFTIEEFLEKFPYKIGDKALLNGIVKTIKQARWDIIDNEVIYKIETNIRGFSEEYYVHYYDLQPYKEETMEEIKIDIPKGYEFFGIDDDNKIVLTKKQPEYPKNYKECCDVLKIPNDERYIDIDVPSGYNKLLSTFTELIICRKAYWKIAGEQMGLGKPWKPKWEIDNVKYSILFVENEIRIGDNEEIQRLLVFPTKEMRDAFYDNFKELIEQCKELL